MLKEINVINVVDRLAEIRRRVELMAMAAIGAQHVGDDSSFEGLYDFANDTAEVVRELSDEIYPEGAGMKDAEAPEAQP